MQWFSSVAEFFSRGWVQLVIGLLGSYLFFRWSRKRKCLAYRCVHSRMLGFGIEGLPTDITMQYRGQEIPRLTRTVVVFWNSGEETILGGDIVPVDKLRLRFLDDGRVLSATILKQSRGVCEVQAQVDPVHPNEVSLSCSFLDSSDGAVIEVLHTSEKPSVEFLGTVLGIPKGFQQFGNIEGRRSIQLSYPFLAYWRKFGRIATVVGAIVFGAGVFDPLDMTEKLHGDAMSRPLLIFAGALYFVIGLFMMVANRQRYPNSLHTDELD